MKVGVFIPLKSMIAVHVEIMQAVATGIPNAVLYPLEDGYVECDVAVMFGLWKRAHPSPTKQAIMERHSGSSLLVMEHAFVRRGDYWSMGWGGINGHADFRVAQSLTLDRWRSLGVRAQQWERDRLGHPFVVCGQVPWDVTVQDTDHPAWCVEAVSYYRKRGMPVMFRPHPRMLPDWQQHYPKMPAVPLSIGPLKTMLSEARALVTWNSNVGVDGVVNGVPVIACDPGSRAWAVSVHEIGATLKFPARTTWLAGIGYSQWSLGEIRAGLAWQHLTGKK